ncbi:MAG: ribosome biogenesis GTPase YlqF [Clostridia bacterium]|nr:ribosome biogenesis GTPase YlqF [Clostridia bacterium]
MAIQWFPGHMAKTRKQISEDIKLVDVIYELVDARIPMSSRNPEIDKIAADKPRILLLNKADMADDDINNLWIDYFKKQGVECIKLSCKSGEGIEKIQPLTQKILSEKNRKRKDRGIVDTSIKAMIVGIPNVGKSTFINKLSGRAGAKTGDRPGVTTGKQWITVKGDFKLLDTPGILWPKFEDENVGFRLAFTGAIKDEIMDVEELACRLLEVLSKHYPDNIFERYKIDCEGLDSYDLLEEIGRKRGCVMSGGSINTERCANMLLDEFRATKIGKISLEKPTEEM